MNKLFQSKNIRHFFGFVLLVATLMVPAGFVRAEFDDALFSEREKVGFAFYKLANIAPKFEPWVKNTTRYRDTPVELRAMYLQERMSVLQKGFDAYEPAKDYLRFMVPVEIYVPNKLQRDQMIAEGKDIPVQVEVRFFEDKFFPYQIGESWIAVTMSEFDQYVTFNVNRADFETFADNLGMDPYAKSWGARIEIILMPARVDLSAPISRKGKSLWAMDTHLAQVVLWQSYNKKYVWQMFKAPWYQSEDGVNLMQLYKR